jgi:hypothetical protein
MYFEILGDISNIETFAKGRAIHEFYACGKLMDVAAGANEKGSLGSDWRMVW